MDIMSRVFLINEVRLYPPSERRKLIYIHSKLVTRIEADFTHECKIFVAGMDEECRFACICLADNGHGYAVFYGVALLERANQAVDDVLYLVGNGHELCTVGKLEVFMVGEVELKLH